jgi:hypothetical protein
MATQKAATVAVRFAVATLPRNLRERYREQWAADLRDAEEVGIRPSQIAFAALAFSVTMPRPLPVRAALTVDQISRRGRVAAALALGAALLGLSQYASIVPSRDLTDGLNPGIILPAPGELITGFLTIFAVIAPVLGVVIAGTTRGIPRRVRVAVLLLAIASCAPVVQFAIDGPNVGEVDPYLSVGALAYVAGGVLTVAAGVLLVRGRRRPQHTSRLSVLWAIIGGTLITGTVLSGGAIASTLWAHRRPVVWDGTTAAGPAVRSNPYYEQWMTSWKRGELAIASTFEWWVVAGVVLGVLIVFVVLVGRMSVRSLVILVAATAAAVVIATMGLLIVLQLNEAQTVDMEAVESVLVLARVGLVLVIAIGGVAAVRATSPGASSRARRASRRAALR